MKKGKIFIGLIAIFVLLSMSVFGQQKCIFVVVSESLSAEDVVINAKLVEWGYEVTPMTPANVEWLLPEDFTSYDFIFISESIGSGDAKSLASAPLPMANLEGWAVKPGAMDWEDNPRTVNNFNEGDVIIVDGNHPLAAGFATGATVTLITNTTDGAIVASNPDIPIIPIAVRTTADTMKVVYGIEKGTHTMLDTVIQNRIATVGINALGYPSLTDDAFKLMKAAIDWVLSEPTGVAKEELAPANYALNQNYPNPFNPTTQIQYSLGTGSDVEITVYDLVGNKVATLVNGYQSAGNHDVVWDASEATAGVYLYQLKTNNVVETKKMLLVK